MTNNWLEYLDKAKCLGLNSRLNSPAEDACFLATEGLVGKDFPQELKDIYRHNDGQEYGVAPVLPEAFFLLSMGDIKEVWEMWSETVANTPGVLWRENWLPVGQNIAGDLICFVLSDEEHHDSGEVLLVGTQSDQEIVLSKSVSSYFASALMGIKNGRLCFKKELSALVWTK